MILRPFSRGRIAAIVSLACLVLLAACSKGWKPADYDSDNNNSYQVTADGHYRVRRGDTLHAIAFNFGMDWRDIADWNSIRSPYIIYPDQELRLSAPPGQRSQKQSPVPVASSGGTGTAKTDTGAESSSNRTIVKAAPAKSSTSTSYDNAGKSETSKSVATADPGKWLWPADGRVISNFKPNDPARKGVDIGGKEGQAVIASAAGEVVYSGSGLIGYGELIIIKHSERLLSAYAHNRKRLVAEGQQVAGGERIAEMGRNDRNQAMLHFEIRLNGSPQDPLKYLPGR
jgi:lipoprotein NlpD